MSLTPRTIMLTANSQAARVYNQFRSGERRRFGTEGTKMRSFAQKQNRPQHTAAIHQAKSNAAAIAASHTIPAMSRFASDFSGIPVHGPAESESPIQLTRVAEPKLWRKCACGGSCPQCKADEQQYLQMQPAGSNSAGHMTAPPIVGEALASSAGSLPGGLRADMENRFAHNFSGVRVHTHARGAESAAAVGARAYTVGSNVVFAAGEYAPNTNAGRRLIAHELAHVVQQGGSHAANPNTSIQIGASNDPLEREAEAAAQHANEDAFAGAASASLSTGVSRLARTPLLQRDDGPTGKKEEAPMERVPYRDKPAEEKKPEADEADQGPALVPASGARPTCNPQGFLRKDYLAQPNTSTDDFGLTRFAGTVSVAFSTHKVKGGVALDPLQVALPPITSVYTDADTFIEGMGTVLSSDRPVCSETKVPLQWRISTAGAAKIREGEVEHCDDLQYAYDVTLGWYGQVVDGLIAKGKTFPDEAAAFKHLKRLTGKSPNEWGSTFNCLANKTELRDRKKPTVGWHTPRVKAEPARAEDSCKFSVVRITGASNFPELGKHPTPSVITGCGESPDAVKALAAKAAAAKAAAGAGGGAEQEAKPGDAAPKKAEPPPKSTEPGQ